MPRDGVADGACCVLLAVRPSKGTAIDKEYLSGLPDGVFQGEGNAPRLCGADDHQMAVALP